MSTAQTATAEPQLSSQPPLVSGPVCSAGTCTRVTERVVAIKDTLVTRFRSQGVPMVLIRQAIATAEPQAWLSGFPHLVLPELADEILRARIQKLIHPEYAQAA